MPANVGVEFGLAKNKYEKARTNEEKLAALQEMLSAAPTHKGAENLRKDISRKISALKKKIEKEKITTKKAGHTINIRKEGAGQVLIISLPNCGKSTFLQEFTNAKPEIANYAYTTTKPEVGTLNYGGAKIQLIELPSFLKNSDLSSQIYSMVRVCDLVILLVQDASFEQLDTLISYFKQQDIYITRNKPKVDIIKSKFNNLAFVNKQNLLEDKKKTSTFLKEAGFSNHTFILNEKVSLKDIMLLINPRVSYVSSMCVSMPITTKKNFNIKEYKNIPLFNFKDKEEIKHKIFDLLNKIIVYTKKPGKKADTNEPLVLDKGSTVLDAAREIHKSIYKQINSAKLWGSSKYPGQQVSKNYILKNKDIVEFII
jgi:ribosome-interacting GTPase 1